MKGETVFCVHIDIVEDGCEIMNTPELYQNEKDAVKFFIQEALKEREFAIKSGWTIEDDDEDTFCAYEDGNYNENHVCITIRSLVIN